MDSKRYNLIFLENSPDAQGFTNTRRGGPSFQTPSRDRAQHGDYLQQRMKEAISEAEKRAEQYRPTQAIVQEKRKGINIEFFSEKGFDLALKSLEDMRSGIRLLAVRKEGEGELERTKATVYMPFDKRGHFLQKITDYAEANSKSGKPKNATLIESISDIRLAVVKSFWRPEEFVLCSYDALQWVEVWLSSNKDDDISSFEDLLRRLSIESSEGILKFPERSVKLIRANQSHLEQLLESSDSIAEFRLAKEVATFYSQMENRDQIAIVQQLLSRAHFENKSGVAVCILDGGVNNGHLLIQPVLSDNDLHTARSKWGINDHDGHGTLMAGTAAYGNILDLLNGDGSVRIVHCLESAKILPPPPEENERELWGYITAQGISLAEIQAPQRKRIICMAVTSPDSKDRGRPSSWSAKIDEMASGYEDDKQRLIVVSAGNVEDPNDWRNYPDANLTKEIHDPGQAWNALTVGAFTEKTRITDRTLQSYSALAPSGGLSPYSTTSCNWPSRKWPIKPEVLFEGGNVASGPHSSRYVPDDLRLLSTCHEPQKAQFMPFNATSAASAQAAWMAAQIQAQYPHAWPETVRALIVHSANWTQTMMDQFSLSDSKSDNEKRLRVFGYGVPDMEKALYCLSNSLTLISQATIQPFDKKDGRYVTGDMHLYDLPWPKDALLLIGETQVTMRLTLSYFVEPGPGEVGWKDRYRYASHTLRFEMNRPSESKDEFVKRINAQARNEEEQRTESKDSGNNWLLGQARNVGSIHSDIWKGKAADLATSNLIAVYPAVGWWRERHYLRRWTRQSRYALVVSIYTEEQTIDIYTPVATLVSLEIPIE